MKKICIVCEKEFESKIYNKKCCSRICVKKKDNEYNRQYKLKNPNKEYYSKDYRLEKYQQNKNKILKQQKEYYLENREKKLKYRKRYYLENLNEIRKKDTKYRKIHRKEINIKNQERWNKFRDKWYSGLFCDRCGSENNLDFHHINPENKKYIISEMICNKFLEIFSEIAKCIVLCHSCHAIHHSKLRKRGNQKHPGQFSSKIQMNALIGSK